MSITLNHRAVSALAKLDTHGLAHAKRLELFAHALGFSTGSALMAAARDKAETKNAADQSAVAKVPDHITARMWTHDFIYDINVDATDWLKKISGLQFVFLAKSNFKDSGARGLFLEKSILQEDVMSMKRHLTSEFYPEGPNAYSVSMRKEEVMRWAFYHRHDLYTDLIYLNLEYGRSRKQEPFISLDEALGAQSGHHDFIVKVYGLREAPYVASTRVRITTAKPMTWDDAYRHFQDAIENLAIATVIDETNMRGYYAAHPEHEEEIYIMPRYVPENMPTDDTIQLRDFEITD